MEGLILFLFQDGGNPEILDLLIFDCCRGNNMTETLQDESSKIQVGIMEDNTANNTNAYYKNVIIIHSTLNNQVLGQAIDLIWSHNSQRVQTLIPPHHVYSSFIMFLKFEKFQSSLWLLWLFAFKDIREVSSQVNLD